MKKKQRITVSLSQEVWTRVQKQAELRSMSASALARLMMEASLTKLEDEKLDTLFERLVTK